MLGSSSFALVVDEGALVAVSPGAPGGDGDGVGVQDAVTILVSHVLDEELYAFWRRPAKT